MGLIHLSLKERLPYKYTKLTQVAPFDSGNTLNKSTQNRWSALMLSLPV